MLQRKSRIHHLCCQKYFRRLYSYRNTVGLNCHFYVMEDTKANVCIFKTMIMQFEAGPKRGIKHWTIYKKSFRFGRLSLGYVVCFVSVYTVSCCLHQCRVLVIFCLCTYYIIFFFYLFLPLIIQKVRGRRRLTFQTTAFR